MIDREVTAGLGRRFLAFLIDGSMVAAAGAGAAYRQSETFDIVGRDANGEPLIDPSDFDRYEPLLDFEILGRTGIFDVPFVRAQEIGDSVRVFGADSYAGAALAVLVAGLVLQFLIPTILGRTLGMLPFGIGIRSLDGSRAGIGPNLVRAVFGAVDVLPVALPGALGFLLAARSKKRQRLGDALAGTTVVSMKALRALDDAPEVTIDLRAPDHGDTAPGDITDRGDDTSPADPIEPAPSDLDGGELIDVTAAADSTVADAAPTSAATTTSSPSAKVAEAATAARRSTDTASRRAHDPSAPPIARPTIGDPLPPPPVHRTTPTARPLGTHGPLDANANPLIDDDDPVDAGNGLASRVDAPTGRVDVDAQETLPLGLDDLEPPAAEVEVPTDTWQPPREEPAPVWQPSPLETAPIESPDPHDGRAIDDIAALEPSVGAMLAENPTTAARPGKHSASTSSAKTPVWSDKWRAWMYWDPKRRCWLRHDTDANEWVPVD